MSVFDIVDVQITKESATVDRAGFGVGLVAAYHTVTGNLVDEYADLTEMTDAGFAVTEAAYKAAQAYFSQTFKPDKVLIGRRSDPTVQTVTLTPTDTTPGLDYLVQVVGLDGSIVEATFTVPASPGNTVAAIVTGLVASLGAPNGVTVADNVTDVGLSLTTPANGGLFDVKLWAERGKGNIDLADTSADPGIAAELALFRAERSDWYGLMLDSNSEQEVLAAAAWAESQTVLFLSNSSDAACGDSGSTTDVMALLSASSYIRTACIFSGRELLGYSGASWMGEMFPRDPGSATWNFKTLAGVLVDDLKGAFKSTIEGKNGNYYITIGGQNTTQDGRASGNEWLDITRGIDWLQARIAEDIFALLKAAPKIFYTDAGADRVGGTVAARLEIAIQRGVLASDPAPIVTVPKVADVPPATRAARLLPDVKFTGQLAGAIHTVEVRGKVTV